MQHSKFRPGKSISLHSGLTLNYETLGAGQKAALFLHGFGASLRNWDDIRPFLSQSRKNVFLDLKGCGFSSKPADSNYSVVDHAHLVSRFIITKDLRNLTLIGHSYGGAVALLTQQALVDLGEPSRINKLILIDSAGFAMGDTYPLAQLRIPALGWLLVNVVPASIQAYTTLRIAFRQPAKISREVLRRYTFWYSDRLWRRALLKAAEEAVPERPEEYQNRFADVRQECLLIWGRQDRIIPITHLENFQETLPNTTTCVIEECGHMPQEEQPELTARAIGEFLTQGRPGDPRKQI